MASARGSSRGRAGRRPGASTTREAILAAARARFAANGYDGVRVRDVAADAGVDAALVHYFFKTKDGLFAAALEIPVRPSEVLPSVLDGGLEGAGERIVTRFLAVWDDPAARPALLALVRSSSGNATAASAIREFLEREVVGRIAKAIGGSQAQLRATLVGSQMIGLVIARYVLELEPLAGAPAADIVAAIGPNVQRYLTGELSG